MTGQPCVLPPFDNNCAPDCTVTTCSCTGERSLVAFNSVVYVSPYWSATTVADGLKSIDFNAGSVSDAGTLNSSYARAVRGP